MVRREYREFEETPRENAETLLSALGGNEDALLALLKRCEPLICKYAKLPGGKHDPDLMQLLIVEWIAAVKAFDPLRYCSEIFEGTDQL
jgi:DNA-directed RNA polymerase specialized sigma subunit